MADEENLPDPDELEERLSQWAKDQTELAEALGCNRKTIQRWLKSKDADCPGMGEDGRFNVTLWKIWVETKGKKVRATAKHRDKGALDVENMRLKNEKLEIENMLRRGDLMHVDEVCKVLGEMFGAFVPKVRGMKHTLPHAIVGVSVPEAAKRVDREAVEALQELSLGDWAKKKPFWSIVYARLSDLQAIHGLGNGRSAT